jgi:hypothetical protein
MGGGVLTVESFEKKFLVELKFGRYHLHAQLDGVGFDGVFFLL